MATTPERADATGVAPDQIAHERASDEGFRRPEGDSPEEPSLRRRILDEAARLFAEHGYAATAMREVADAAACTKPAIYYYFGSKEGLFLATLQSEIDVIDAETRDIQQRRGPLKQLMVDALTYMMDRARDQPHRMALLMRAEHQPDRGQPAFDFEKHRRAHHHELENLLRQGIERGEVRADVRVDDAVDLIVSYVERQMCRMVVEGVPIPEDFPERAIDLFFRGVAA